MEEYHGDMGDAGEIGVRLGRLREALKQRLIAALDETNAQAILAGRLFYTLTLLTELALPPAVTLADWLHDSYGWMLETA
jgi:hypothetical protein